MKPGVIVIHTGGVTQWIEKWKRNGWRTSPEKQVKNVDLWKRLEAAGERHEITWEWVKGHSGVPDNERADELAAQGCEEAQVDTLVETWGLRAAGQSPQEASPRPVGEEPPSPQASEERCLHDLIVGQCAETQCALLPEGLVAHVYITAGGKSMHRTHDCLGLLDGHQYAAWRGHEIHDPVRTLLRVAQTRGYAPCERCLPHA